MRATPVRSGSALWEALAGAASCESTPSHETPEPRMARPFVDIDRVAMRYGVVEGPLAIQECISKV